MAYQQITYACGYKTQKNLAGNAKRRQSYADWCANQNCGLLDCEKCGQLERDHREGLAVLGAKEGMIGSPKQISWAMSIKEKFVQEVQKELERLAKIETQCQENTDPAKQDDAEKTLEKIVEIRSNFEKLLKNQNAKDWIDYRSTTPRELTELYTTNKQGYTKDFLKFACGN